MTQRTLTELKSRWAAISVHVATFVGATGQRMIEVPETEYAAHGGGFPIRVAGAGRVGLMVVSGLPQLDDHALVVECLRALRERS